MGIASSDLSSFNQNFQNANNNDGGAAKKSSIYLNNYDITGYSTVDVEIKSYIHTLQTMMALEPTIVFIYCAKRTYSNNIGLHAQNSANPGLTLERAEELFTNYQTMSKKEAKVGEALRTTCYFADDFKKILESDILARQSLEQYLAISTLENIENRRNLDFPNISYALKEIATITNLKNISKLNTTYENITTDQVKNGTLYIINSGKRTTKKKTNQTPNDAQ